MSEKTIFRMFQNSRNALGIVLMTGLAFLNLQAGELSFDEHTVLLFHFNDNLNDVSGVEPVNNSGQTFTDGVFGSALQLDKNDTLWYPMPENFNPAEGSVEFWISPRWSGDEAIMRIFHTHDWHPITLQIDPGYLMHLFMLVWDNEANYYDVSRWNDEEWHHLAVTWKIPGEMRLYVDGVLRIHDLATELDLLPLIPPLFKIGGQTPAENVVAVIDEMRLSNIERSEKDILESVLAREFTINSMEIEPEPIRLMPGWSFRPALALETGLGISHLPVFAADISIDNPLIVECDSLGFLHAVGSGSAQLTAEYNGIQAIATVNVDPVLFEPEYISVDSFLATPANGFLWEVPVVIIQYLPVLDSTWFEWYVPTEFTTLEEMKNRLHYFNRRIKFAAEEGSRYHGYQDSTALPSLGYRVVSILNIYEHMPMSDVHCGWNMANKYPDYHQVMNRINGQNYVNNLGVKEFWIWYHGYEMNGYGFELPESNLSSPLTGDISNSGRLRNDLPVYNHTYTLYQFDMTSNHAYAIHNFGHQIENQISYINRRQEGNEDLFFKKFCGMDNTNTWITGRCGWTHMPPNTTSDYIYDDTTLVLSDCEDWNPQHDGIQKWVNVATWRDIPYDWPVEPDWTHWDSPYSVQAQRAETHFYIYWRQNIPGRDNEISYGSNAILNNWWQVMGDWDNVITGGEGLYTVINRSVPNLLLNSFQLYQNYPNPFNPATRIQYGLPEQSHVNLMIYDISGRLIKNWRFENQSSGWHDIIWNGTNSSGQQVSTGVYIYQLQAGDFVETKKMVFMK